MPQTSPTAAQPAANAGQNRQEQGFVEKYGGLIFRALIVWLGLQYFFGARNMNPTPHHAAVVPAATTETNVQAPPVAITAKLPSGVYYSPVQPVFVDLPQAAVPLWASKTTMDLLIYINENDYFVDYDTEPSWRVSGLVLDGNDKAQEKHIEIPATAHVQNNGTVYAHVLLTKRGAPINPAHPAFTPNDVVYLRHTLTKFYPKKSQVKQKNLLQKDSGDHQEDEATAVKEEKQVVDESLGGLLGNWTRKAPLVSYWHENMTLSIVTDFKSPIPRNAMQPATLQYIPFDVTNSRDESGKIGFYRPIVYPNDFWLLRQNAYPINDTLSTLPLTIHLEPLSMWKFNMYAMFDDSMKQQANNPLGGMSSSEMDEVKRMFLETNPILLVTTIAVSLLHSVFEFLAFKNDIAFWKKKDNSAGVSVRSILVNIFFQIVIFLYLVDNNQETSWMILISQGVGLLIEIWKVFKALKYELIWTPGSLIPSVRSQESENTQTEDETAEYDAIAFRYIQWIAYPLLAGYAVYSLLYDEHKSWYSYVLKTLVEFVYMFGFITMLPQLYINYRLKSVAHMPWRTLMYKSLNTFIDDLFAFVIKMPTLHRLACLRDDVVFFVYLYQRWAYKVDPTRANEFGQVGLDVTKTEAENEQDKESKKTK